MCSISARPDDKMSEMLGMEDLGWHLDALGPIGGILGLGIL